MLEISTVVIHAGDAGGDDLRVDPRGPIQFHRRDLEEKILEGLIQAGGVVVHREQILSEIGSVSNGSDARHSTALLS